MWRMEDDSRDNNNLRDHNKYLGSGKAHPSRHMNLCSMDNLIQQNLKRRWPNLRFLSNGEGKQSPICLSDGCLEVLKT